MAEYGGYYLLSALAGTALQANAQHKADLERGAILKRAGKTQDELTNKAIGLTTSNAQQYNAVDRLAAEDQAEKAAESSLGQALTKAAGVTSGNDAMQGKISDDFLTARAKRSADTLARNTEIAKLMAKVRAPLDLRFNEGLSNEDTASKSATLNSEARNALQAGQLDAGMVAPNGTQMLTGDLMRVAGVAGYAGRKTPATMNTGLHETATGNPYS